MIRYRAIFEHKITRQSLRLLVRADCPEAAFSAATAALKRERYIRAEWAYLYVESV